MPSIRVRLLWALLLTILVLSLAASVATYLRARADVNALFDYEIRQMALILSLHISAHPDLTEEPLLRVEQDHVTQIWSRQGQLLFSSRPGQGPERLLPDGFADTGERRQGWRIFTVAAGDYALQVAQPQSLRQRMAADIAFNAMLPVLAIIPLGGLIIWLVIGYGLKPLRALAHEVQARAPAHMHPIVTAHLPSEAAPLVAALNHLLVRLERASQSERAFIADASHELRTPITALNLQLGLLESAASTEEREEAIRDLRRGVERTGRLIEQLLTLARIEPDNAQHMETLDLAALVQNLCEDSAHIAAAKSITLKVQAQAPAIVSGEHTSLTALFRNILDNALGYTPAGGKVALKVDTVAGALQVCISDTGPGIPAPLREQVFARFFRGENPRHDTGAGLGLAIAKRAAERLNASVQLGDGFEGKGLSVTIRFAPAARGSAA